MKIRKSIGRAIPTAQLGGGYSDDREMPTTNCCVHIPSVYYDGSSVNIIDFGSSITYEVLTQKLSNSVAAGINIGIFSTDITTNYLQYIKEERYSLSAHFYEQIQLPTRMFQPTIGIDALNSYGKGAYNLGLPFFRAHCGNKFIHQEQLGANLFASLKINFATTYDKETFSQHSSTSFLGITVASSTIEQISIQYNLKGNVEFSALQIGGDAEKLAEIFSMPVNNYYIAPLCDIKNLQSCNVLITNVLAYAANKLPHQLGFANGNVTGNPGTINYVYSDYTSLGLNKSQSIVTPAIREARAQLITYLQQYSNFTAILNNILNVKVVNDFLIDDGGKTGIYQAQVLYWDSSLILPNVLSSLQANYNNGLYNSAILMNQDPQIGAIGCYFYPENCVELALTIQGNFSQTDFSIINQFSIAYVLNAVDTSNSNYFINRYYFPIGNNQHITECVPISQYDPNGQFKFTHHQFEINNGVLWNHFLDINNGNTLIQKATQDNDVYNVIPTSDFPDVATLTLSICDIHDIDWMTASYFFWRSNDYLFNQATITPIDNSLL